MAACWASMREQRLVVLGEAAAVPREGGLGQRLLARKSAPRTSSPSATGRPRKSDMSGWAAGQPLEAGVLADVGEPLGRRLVQHRGEDAVLAGQRADGLPLLVADAVHHELGEAAVVVGHAQGGVLGVQQLAGGGDDRLEDVAHLQMPAHRQDRGAHRGDPRSRSVGHGLTVPAGRPARIGPMTAAAYAHRPRPNALATAGPAPDVRGAWRSYREGWRRLPGPGGKGARSCRWRSSRGHRRGWAGRSPRRRPDGAGV